MALFGGKAAVPDTEADSDRAEGDLDISAARAALEATRGGGRRGKRKAVEDAGPSPAETALKELFGAEQWEGIVSLYPDIRFAMTGDEDFLLNDKEMKILSTNAAMTAKMLIAIDPRYVAVALLLINFTVILGKKEIRHAHKKRKAKVAEK